MTATRKILTCLLAVITSLCFGANASSAQGFRLFSGRNHPELKWLVAETDHFRIMYPEHLSGIDLEAAAIAETTYAALSQNLNVTFDDRIRIYLSDEDEIANGYASRVGNGWTNIWVNVNSDADNWTGRHKWLRRVLPHELAHIFHYRAVRSGLGLLDVLFSSPLPRFWTEGVAQYQTEEWDALRGDIWLRTAVLEDQLSYRDGRSVWNGRLLYAVGNSQVRFLASQYGDSTLAKILAHRKPALLGIARVHDFEDAFKSVVGKPHRDFYDDWRRHVNIYYNTVAGQLVTIDSLDARTLDLPGQYLYDIATTPDSAFTAVLYLESVDRPVRKLVVIEHKTGMIRPVSEGAIQSPVSISPDGSRVAFSRRSRGINGSLIFDVFIADQTGLEQRLTFSRRASSPSFSPDGNRLAFVAAEGTTANVFVEDLVTRKRSQVTSLDGNRQVGSIRWSPDGTALAYYLFDEDGSRAIESVEMDSRKVRRHTSGTYDDRRPVWSPDGTAIGFTSLRDGVPNVFEVNVADTSARRVTHLATGATLADWVRPDSSNPRGRMIVIVGDSKEEDRGYSVGVRSNSGERLIDVPPEYSSWTRHRPPHVIPPSISSREPIVRKRYAYSSWKNITHVASLGVPYYSNRDDWGVFGATAWTEPLGKHFVAGFAGLSVASPRDNSFLAFTYINNQFRPTLSLAVSRFPEVGRPYGKDILEEDRTDIAVAAEWPLDWRSRPYVSTRVLARIRFIDVAPLNAGLFLRRPDGLPVPEAGEQLSFRIAASRKKLRPFRDNLVHPLDGWGVRGRVTVATRRADFKQSYVRFESSAFRIVPVIGRHRLYVFGRFRGQEGESLPQDFVGLSRYDYLQVRLAGLEARSSESDRVRGYRRLVIGNRVLFGSLEYRIPLVPSLRTEVLGLLSLGATTVAPFLDAAVVWARPLNLVTVDQLSVGVEVKNALRIGGILDIIHAVGFAQPASALGSQDRYEIYYRIQTAIPF